jgi:hypothetical protein
VTTVVVAKARVVEGDAIVESPGVTETEPEDWHAATVMARVAAVRENPMIRFMARTCRVRRQMHALSMVMYQKHR